MKMVKNLTAANIRNYEGFERREDLDFSDDGNRFRGFSYKGMPITTLRSNKDNTTYLSIRVDYLNNLQFTYRQWMETEEWMLCDEFNGVAEFDLDQLVEYLERIIAKVNEMNEAASKTDVDMTQAEETLAKEIRVAQEIVDIFKTNFKWYDCPAHKLTTLINYMKSAEHEIEEAKAIDLSAMPKAQKNQVAERCKIHGYVRIRLDSLYYKSMVNALG